jgi:hypothetical protein
MTMTAKEKIRLGIYLFIKALKRIFTMTNLNRLVKIASLLIVLLCVPTLFEQAPPVEQWQPEVKATFIIAGFAFLNYLTRKS